MFKNKLYKFFLIIQMFALLSSCVQVEVTPKQDSQGETVQINGTISE